MLIASLVLAFLPPMIFQNIVRVNTVSFFSSDVFFYFVVYFLAIHHCQSSANLSIIKFSQAFCKPTSHTTANILHPTSNIINIPYPQYPTSQTSHIPNITHPKHPTSWTSHMSNILYYEHPLSRKYYIPNISHPEHPTSQTIKYKKRL